MVVIGRSPRYSPETWFIKAYLQLSWLVGLQDRPV